MVGQRDARTDNEIRVQLGSHDAKSCVTELLIYVPSRSCTGRDSAPDRVGLAWQGKRASKTGSLNRFTSQRPGHLFSRDRNRGDLCRSLSGLSKAR